MSQNSAKKICVGAFAGAHGVKGAALVKAFTDTPENIDAYGVVKTKDGSQSFKLKFQRVIKSGFVVVTASEIATREEALALKGTRLYVDRDQLPAPSDGDFYHEDLIGLAVFDETGAPMGQVNAVYNFGAGDLLEIKEIPDIKGVRVAPFTLALVPEINIPANRITILREAIEINEDDEPQTKGDS